MKPLVSILIPAHNAEKWIAETIESALAQVCPGKEIIIVDDGSTDRTLSVARRFASAAVNVLTQPRQGASAARNKAYSICQGDYIQWLDADDLLSPDKIARQLEIAESSQDKYTLYSSGWGRFYYRTANAKFIPTALWCDLAPVEWVLRKFEYNLHMQTATWLVSRELSETVGPWNIGLSVDDDGEYFCRAILRSRAIRFVPDAKVFYRITESNRLSHIGKNKEKLEAQFRGMQIQINHLIAERDDERVRAACVTYLQNWLLYFYPSCPEIVKEMMLLAQSLGGQLKSPDLSWKYAWIQKAFGWRAAATIQMEYNQRKTMVLRTCDKAVFHLRAGK